MSYPGRHYILFARVAICDIDLSVRRVLHVGLPATTDIGTIKVRLLNVFMTRVE